MNVDVALELQQGKCLPQEGGKILWAAVSQGGHAYLHMHRGSVKLIRSYQP